MVLEMGTRNDSDPPPKPRRHRRRIIWSLFSGAGFVAVILAVALVAGNASHQSAGVTSNGNIVVGPNLGGGPYTGPQPTAQSPTATPTTMAPQFQTDPLACQSNGVAPTTDSQVMLTNLFKVLQYTIIHRSLHCLDTIDWAATSDGSTIEGRLDNPLGGETLTVTPSFFDHQTPGPPGGITRYNVTVAGDQICASIVEVGGVMKFDGLPVFLPGTDNSCRPQNP